MLRFCRPSPPLGPLGQFPCEGNDTLRTTRTHPAWSHPQRPAVETAPPKPRQQESPFPLVGKGSAGWEARGRCDVDSCRDVRGRKATAESARASLSQPFPCRRERAIADPRQSQRGHPYPNPFPVEGKGLSQIHARVSAGYAPPKPSSTCSIVSTHGVLGTAGVVPWLCFYARHCLSLIPSGNGRGVMGGRAAHVCRALRGTSALAVRYLIVWFDVPSKPTAVQLLVRATSGLFVTGRAV